MKLRAILCRATQDGLVMVESSGKTWSPREGNGKPLQYSCLENPMTVWTVWIMVVPLKWKHRILTFRLPVKSWFESFKILCEMVSTHGVTKSWTQLSNGTTIIILTYEIYYLVFNIGSLPNIPNSFIYTKTLLKIISSWQIFLSVF